MDKVNPGEFTKVRSIIRYLKPGDLIEFESTWMAKHWAVYTGQDDSKDSEPHTIVHLSTEDEVASDYLSQQLNVSAASFPSIGGGGVPQIIKSDLLDFSQDRKCRINNSDDASYNPLTVITIITRAESLVASKPNYDLFANNCEHFVRWCRYDRAVSEQVVTAKGLLTGLACAFSFGMEIANASRQERSAAFHMARQASNVLATQAVTWYRQDDSSSSKRIDQGVGAGEREHEKGCKCYDCLFEKSKRSKNVFFCSVCYREECSCQERVRAAPAHKAIGNGQSGGGRKL